jgi:hypothetical protein
VCVLGGAGVGSLHWSGGGGVHRSESGDSNTGEHNQPWEELPITKDTEGGINKI